MATRTTIMKQSEAETERSIQILSADPGGPVNNQVWINTSTSELKARISGVTQTFGGGSGASTESLSLGNLGLAGSVAANALTIALKQADGSTNPSSGSAAVQIAFRSSTALTAAAIYRSVTGALSIVVPSTATLGHTDGDLGFVHVYALDNAGTVELAVAGTRSFDEGSRVSTTILNTSSDDLYTLYSTTARTDVPIRYLGRFKSTQTTAGTWASAMSEGTINGNREKHSISEVWVYYGHASANFGSTNDKIRRFAKTGKNVGSAITYADSATNGGSFTINEPGLYKIDYSDRSTGGGHAIGVSRNSTQLTTGINGGGFTELDRIAFGYVANASMAACSFTGRLDAGDIIRAHTDGIQDASEAATAGYPNYFRITKIGD